MAKAEQSTKKTTTTTTRRKTYIGGNAQSNQSGNTEGKNRVCPLCGHPL